jgi:hypothetical protein
MKDPYDGHAALLYEVDVEADAAIAGPFDMWLRDHIADVLALPGFLSAEILEAEPADPSRVRRVVQYRLRDQDALETYLRDQAPLLRRQGEERFGDRFRAGRRVLTHREEFVRGAVSTDNCLNCGEVLTGQHCAHCGQRASVRVISLWGMLKDLTDDLLDWDSRVWRTLRPLAFKPGWLTQQFLLGRRVSFTPPFRLYLILSVGFFLLASIGNSGNVIEFRNDSEGTGFMIGPHVDKPGNGEPGSGVPGTDGVATPGGAGSPSAPAAEKAPAAADGKPPAAAPPPQQDAAAGQPLDAATQRAIDAVVAKIPDAEEREKVRAELQQKLSRVPAGERETVSKVIADPCSPENLKIDFGGHNSYEQRLRLACTKVMSDKESFGRAVFANIPKTMFVFLPLMALVMAVLYVGSRRYYVEHLVFFVHFHAFFFLGCSVILLAERLGNAGSGPFGRALDTLASILEFIFVFYLPWYLYSAMRRVYGQGRFWTLTKFTVLLAAYFVSILLTFFGLVFFTALTI